jgi:hypothetical protein
LSPLFEAAASDTEYGAVRKALLEGRLPKMLPPTHPARAYSSVWPDLSLYDDGLIILDGRRIVIPDSQRSSVLELLHLPHNGQTKTKEAARQLYYWPTMNNEITLMVEKCKECRHYLPSLASEPLKQTQASGPMTQVGVDLYQLSGKHHLIMVDAFSGWIWTSRLTSLVTEAVTNQLTTWFQDWGWPNVIRSDGGPQFREGFKQFCEVHGISREDGTSSPYNSQSNGLAEAGVKQAKHLLDKCSTTGQDFKEALREYRNAPRADGFSAAQLFLHRRQRGRLPTLPAATAVDFETSQEGSAIRQDSRLKMKAEHDKRAKDLPTLEVGQAVALQNPLTLRWGDETGIVQSIRNSGRTYIVILDADKGIKTRNRRFLRPVKVDPEATEHIPDEEDAPAAPAAPSPSKKTKKKKQNQQTDPIAPRRSARNQDRPVRYRNDN